MDSVIIEFNYRGIGVTSHRPLFAEAVGMLKDIIWNAGIVSFRTMWARTEKTGGSGCDQVVEVQESFESPLQDSVSLDMRQKFDFVVVNGDSLDTAVWCIPFGYVVYISYDDITR